MTQNCLAVNEKGHLTIGGLDTVELAEEFGTPAYIIDEDTVRKNCRTYKNALEKYFGGDSYPLYAGKALCCHSIYPVIDSEGLGADVVSSGELYTVLSAGFPEEKIFFHGNNKTDEDIAFAIKNNIGYFVVDNIEELEAIEAAAEKAEIMQKILLRITPGIDPHTHKAIITGNVDSKFGSAIKTGLAERMVKAALACRHIELCGFHCHIGSQIFESTPFIDAAEIMLDFIADMKAKFGYEAQILNLGGGFGVPYVDDHPKIDYDARIGEVAKAFDGKCEALGITKPSVLLEPGRSIVANAGITLYTVGSVKEIEGFRTYVSIDGGMPDNPRYALYQSQYEAVIANRASETKDMICTLAGRCCESGDLIGENMPLQRTKRGDILAVLVTGAYNYSMASNYNRIPRPPIIAVSGGTAVTAVRRESFEDLLRNEL